MSEDIHVTILESNITQTVGLIDAYNPKDHFIGEFDPVLLLEWAQKVLDTYGPDDAVYIALHPSKDPNNNTSRFLAASAEHGDSIQVMLAGVDCDDVLKVK